MADNHPIRIYVNKIRSKIKINIKIGYYLEFLTSETMKLKESTKSKITEDENSEDVPLEVTKEKLVHCIIVNKENQQDSRVLYTFIPNISFGQLLDISPTSFLFLKTFKSKFLYVEVWFNDQKSKPSGTEDKISINLVIN